ncbi:hypothetical protein ACFUIY_21165 [Streptomyces griseorubiginosus]
MALLAAVVLVWGTVDGHAVECVAAVAAAVLVEVIASIRRTRREA